MLRCRLALLMVLLAPAAARAGPELDAELEQARGLRQSLEYEQALEHAVKARKLAQSRAERRDTAALTGVVLYELRRIAEARLAFREALAADGNAALPTDVSPKLIEDFERERQVMMRRRAARAQAANAPAGTKLEDDRDEVDLLKQPDDGGPEVPAAAGEVTAPAGAVEATPSRVPALVVAGAGVAVLAAGVGFALDARARAADLQRASPGAAISVEDGQKLRDRGQRSQLIGAIGIAAGAVLVAGGVAFAIATPQLSAALSVLAGPDAAGVALAGTF